MGQAFLHGNGGSNPLNFKIVAQAETPASTSRNLIIYPFYQTTLTNNGVTFTDNGDGTVTANGTATGLARFRPAHYIAPWMIWLEPGTYTASGCPSGGSAEGYRFEVWDHDNNVRLVNDVGSGATFTLTTGTHARFSLLVASGLTVSNLKFKPQLEKGSTATGFVKYAQKENLIWVISDVALLEWYMRGSSSAPTWADEVGPVVIGYEASGSAQITSTSTVLNLVRPRSKRRIVAKLIACFQNQDGTSSGWKQMNAYIYKPGGWVQFSSEFSATITVTYPSGSTVTCSDGSTTLTATTTTGSYTFTVPSAGTWTVKVVSGSNSASKSVSITTSGQSESVTLSYLSREYLVQNGKAKYTFSTQSQASGYENDYGYYAFMGNGGGYWGMWTKVDLTGYKTLTTKGVYELSSGYTNLCVWPTSTSSPTYENTTAKTALTENGATLDVSSLSGNYYVGLSSTYTYAQQTADMYIDP